MPSETETDKTERSDVGESIAVVGVACRFPGAESLSDFWRLLETGGSAVAHGSPGDSEGRVGEMFPDVAPVHDASRYGAFLSGIDQFDAEFFRISPLEAESLDPQQRLLLELSWEALEDAGIAPDRLVGTRSGVYVGIGSYEYQEIVRGEGESARSDTPLYLVTGNRFSTASGRISFALGLEGPSIAVDTACSSSLVAVHHAVAGLQRGEADLALAGGVCVILSPLTTEAFANAGMLSPTGRCWTFDERADGFVRSEGCGMLVLKRLDEAKGAGDRIWGVIRGTAVNQDGLRPGLPAPKGLTQQRVIEEALSRGGIEPSQVDYLEAHGTGTRLGDPTEVNAALAVYGRGRAPGRPLLMGSVKTNIGHLAAGAGAAGLIKVLLSMHRGVIPRHLNLDNPNPEIDWDRLPVQVTTTPTDWPSGSGRPPLAGVSSFGFSGTNSHVVLEGYGGRRDEPANGGAAWPAGPAWRVSPSLAARFADAGGAEQEALPRELRILPLSGKSPAALRDLAGRYLEWLDDRASEQTPLADLAWTAGVGRSHFACRAGLAFRDAASLRTGLEALAAATDAPVPRAPAKVAFAYTGQASQWTGMGLDLYEREPVVRAVLDRCDALLRNERGASLLDVMFGRAGSAGELDEPKWKQPAIYALECALTALWSSVGIRPDVVFGHSLGEIAAAQAAGVFELEDGLKFAAARGALIGALPGAGAMAAVFAPAPRVQAALDEHNAGTGGVGLCIAADNGAHQVVSGPEADIDAVVARFGSEEVRAKRLRKSPAYHSAMVEPVLDDLEAVLSTISFSPPAVSFISNLTGRVVERDEALDAAYWRRQAREPVAFRAGVETLAALGVDTIVEIGPHAVLGPMALLSWPEPTRGTASPPVTLAGLRRPSDSTPGPAGGDAFVDAVARGYEAGLPIDFEGLFAGEVRRRISVPSYPFQRRRHWFEAPKRRRSVSGHWLLGVRHESPHGEVTFETEIFASDPAWVKDHLVFGQVVVPGAMFATMAATVLWGERARSVVLEDCQLHSPMILPQEDSEDEAGEGGRKLQIVFDGADGAAPRRFEVFSRGSEDGWTLHLEGRMSPGERRLEAGERLDLEGLKAELTPGDVASLYRNKVSTRVVLGPAFRPLQAVWSGAGEAVGEVALPDCLDGGGLDLHPILLDGCFQTVLAARDQARVAGKSTYMPFGWDRLWLAGAPPERIFCRVRMREAARRGQSEEHADDSPEVVKADLKLYDPAGAPLGGVDGFTMKRATRAAMLSASNAMKDLLYEVVWREQPLSGAIQPALFLEVPETIGSRIGTFPDYLAAEGVRPEERAALLEDLDRLGAAYVLAALERLGWRRVTGEAVDAVSLCDEMGVVVQHHRLFGRLLGIMAEAGIVKREPDGGLAVAVGSGDELPDAALGEPQRLAEQLRVRHPHGSNELALLERCGGALTEVLQGRSDPLSLLFGSDGASAADLYRTAPAARAANRMLADAVRAAVETLPEGRRLRVLEVGAGTGSATEPILSALPDGRFDYMFTDISAGFFAEAEARFAASGAPIEYRALDIEADPVGQGFESHRYDLVVAANVLHTTRDLEETLAHCRSLLAPRGQLVALELTRGRHLQDLTFGMLDGWWRFADIYRPDHALAAPAVWRRAFSNAGFDETEVLGVDTADGGRPLGPGIIVARGPEEVALPAGVWIVAPDRDGVGEKIAAALAARNQTVVIAGEDEAAGAEPVTGPGVFRAIVQTENRESWRSLVEGLTGDVPFQGIVHLAALDGHGAAATTEQVARDVSRAGASALSLVQGVLDADASPAKGLWFVTLGAQSLERERDGEIGGAALWGFGKAVVREAPQLGTRMIDLDPDEPAQWLELADELLFPGSENHIAYRRGRRHVARLVRTVSGTPRIAFPDEAGWRLAPDEGRTQDGLRVETAPSNGLEPGEVRVAVEAAGLNFRDVLRATGVLETGLLGREMCGRVVEAGPAVTGFAVGDRVVGLAFGAFGPEVVTRGELVAPAPERMPAAALATVPVAFCTAALAFDLTGLKAGERVLIHAGAGGVGLAAIQLARAAGAEVIATASGPKQAYLRSLGVSRVFDSRQTSFGREILDATAGAGVQVVLNSLTGPGFIEASLECLASAGRFVELGARDIWSEAAMAAARPDVEYSILRLDVLKETDPARPGAALRKVMDRLAAGELSPLPRSSWPLAEAAPAMAFMRSARHIGKIALTMPPLMRGGLREDRTYLVTGGLGGIGCAVAGQLADRGAKTIVLNGRRVPDAAAEDAIRALEARGVTVRVELADVTDGAAVDAMLARVDAELPPLAGVIHSVGVLSDGALANQSWERFEEVLWPKVLGAWHLHRATEDRDLDLFILFSSVVGVLGSAGQANHAAANAYLDRLAAHRRARGLPGQAIAWGAWSGVGEAEEQRDRIEDHLAARGVRWITPQQGLRAFGQLVSQDLTTAAVTAVDWSVYAESFDASPALLQDLLTRTTVDNEPATAAPETDLLSSLRAAPTGEREEVLVDFIRQEMQSVLRLSSPPSPTSRFFDLGMDSLMAVELRNRLNRGFAGAYVASNTVVFDYPDTAALGRFLAGEIGELGASDAPRTITPPVEQPERRMPHQPTPPPSEDDRVAERDGIAIVGMACRFPGAADLAAFWNQLAAGVDAVTDGRPDSGVPADSGGDHSFDNAAFRCGGFVTGIDEFDARFFGIRPIEARTMDPQQRMLLETSWQALEDAGMDPGGLKGSRTGVYVGLSGSEYREVIARSGEDIAVLETAGSVAAGRVAFSLGLMGPAMPLDMTCASSLAAVHEAVAALHRGEVNLALAGGVSAVLSPAVTKFMVEVGMLSSTGRCRAFDAAADGYVRGEGCGIVVLRRLADAEANGDRIWGVIRGSAVNHNGASAGLTMPNGPAQESVIEDALSRAGVAPADVDYLEAHGTGSMLGDPIEVQAAAAVYGKGRDPARPLLMGTVKTNIGHLEAAAGVAGIIKVVLAMRRGAIPKHLHFDAPNPHLDWNLLPVRVTTEPTDWPANGGRPPCAAVSAFGISGSNAHLVVEGIRAPNQAGLLADEVSPEGAPSAVAVSLPDLCPDLTPVPEAQDPRAVRLLPLSGKSDDALRALAGRYLTWLDERNGAAGTSQSTVERSLADMAWTAGVGRSHFAHRAGIVFHDAVSLRAGLSAVANVEDGPGAREAAKTAFVYAGEGERAAAAAEALYRNEPVAMALFNRCDAVLREERDVSLLDWMSGESDPEQMLADPAIYAFQCALTALWSSVGVRPSVVVGFGVGELAAAHAAGVLGLEKGLRLAVARDALTRTGPESESAAAEADLDAALAGIEFRPPSIALVSGVTGRVEGSEEMLEAACGLRNVREAATHERCIRTLAERGVEVVVEIGPGGSVGPVIASHWPDSVRSAKEAGKNGVAGPVVLSGRRTADGDGSAPNGDTGFVRAVADAYEAGFPIAFAGLFAGESRRRISVPVYPFERQRYWVDSPKT
ncbi:MAG: SDR family NAD(P)-dependent oxidoreductase [Chromatiales bacterium]|nr:SDR family NAD(P)-dependent oxidoreductase [Chromatiales bacterium]